MDEQSNSILESRNEAEPNYSIPELEQKQAISHDIKEKTAELNHLLSLASDLGLRIFVCAYDGFIDTLKGRAPKPSVSVSITEEVKL